MDENISIPYGDVICHYQQEAGRWVAALDDHDIYADQLLVLQKKIDTYKRESLKFEPYKAYRIDGQRVEVVRVTSVFENYGSPWCRFRRPDHNDGTHTTPVKNIVKITPESTAAFAVYEAKFAGYREAFEALNEAIRALMATGGK